MPNMKVCKRYQIKNWSEYNKALIQRGSINIWIEEGAMDRWLCNKQTGDRGRPQVYSDEAILALLVVRQVFHLPLRALQGFVTSIFLLMGLILPVPYYTQISRRAMKLKKQLKKLTKGEVKEIVFDSSGLKVYGEGEWKVRIHGKSKRRTWRKLHIGMSPNSHEIIVSELTENSVGDAAVAERLLDPFQELERVYGDGSYDSGSFRQAVLKRGGDCIVPPPRNGTYKGVDTGWERERDAILAEIEGLGGSDEGRQLWKKLKGYHRRSLGETAFFRLKTMLGDKLRARSWEGQQSEAYAKCMALNRMTELGMPKGEWVLIS